MKAGISIADRANMITRMLFVCPRLRTLVVRSEELALCLEHKPAVILSSLDHLHLYISAVEDMVNPLNLATVFPNISYFSTGSEFLNVDMDLAKVVLDLLKHLSCLRRLRFNDYDFHFEDDIDQSDDNLVVQMLRNSEELRSKNPFIRVYDEEQLFIWL
jgi:hypothetical protein